MNNGQLTIENDQFGDFHVCEHLMKMYATNCQLYIVNCPLRSVSYAAHFTKFHLSWFVLLGWASVTEVSGVAIVNVC